LRFLRRVVGKFRTGNRSKKILKRKKRLHKMKKAELKDQNHTPEKGGAYWGDYLGAQGPRCYGGRSGNSTGGETTGRIGPA